MQFFTKVVVLALAAMAVAAPSPISQQELDKVRAGSATCRLRIVKRYSGGC